MKNTSFDKFEIDRDIPDKIWDGYLRKYTDEYRVFRGDEGTYKIRCKFGQIEPYSLIHGYLCFAGTFSSPMKKTWFLKKRPANVEVTQDGEWEATVKFSEDYLPSLVDWLGVCKKRRLTESDRNRRREILKKARSKWQAMRND